jgi:hypothetical protein
MLHKHISTSACAENQVVTHLDNICFTPFKLKVWYNNPLFREIILNLPLGEVTVLEPDVIGKRKP